MVLSHFTHVFSYTFLPFKKCLLSTPGWEAVFLLLTYRIQPKRLEVLALLEPVFQCEADRKIKNKFKQINTKYIRQW